jgi:dienelactone hydrolase
MQQNMIGAYGAWAAAIVGDEPAKLSFRSGKWRYVDDWRKVALARVNECLAQPDTGGVPDVTIHRQFTYDGLDVEELSWQLPYGPPTEAYLLKPAGATGKLPGILALHDHGGKKYFGKRKIARIADEWHPMMREHYNDYYGGAAWANEIAKRGYAVLVSDAFPFASRRVLLQDVPERIRGNLSDADPEREENITAYNRWAADHESIMAKSLFCAGTTWPGVFLAEDRRALDVLSGRDDVDAERIGCAGLSGGGMRTVYLGGIDPRIRCAICVGMMSTWRDYLLHKCYTHTWMVYTPLLPTDLDYPEILGLRVPLPTLVQFDIDDQLFTMPEMERSDVMLREVYEKAAAPDHYRGTFYPGPHKFDLEMQAEAFDWFDQWLKV